MPKRTAFTNARLVTADGVIEHTTVLTEGGKIAWVGPDGPYSFEGARIIDAGGLYLSAGLIDLHVHGADGFEFMDATREAFHRVAAYHARHGVTTMLPTVSVCPPEVMTASIEAHLQYAGGIVECNLIGMHLEGPYLAPAQCGAQDPRYILLPDRVQYERFADYGCVLRMSAAPEIAGALEMGDYLRGRGILLSSAHTDAYFDDIARARAHGYSMITHFYSCMEGVRRKNAFRTGGAVEAGLLLNDIDVEIIADGCHLPECLLKLIYKCKDLDRITLTSDATRGAGFADGQIIKTERDREILIEDGVAKLPDRSAFAGSIASGDRLIRTMVSLGVAPLHEAVTMMTVNPARRIGIFDRKGSVEAGKDADLILFDQDIGIKAVMNHGDMICE
jgi:N-acetylglucosamine-6-phosphate deacetylase